MSDGGILDQIARDLTSLIAATAVELFGPGINRPVAGPIAWSDFYVAAFFVVLFFVLHGAAAVLLKKENGESKRRSEAFETQFSRRPG